MEQKEFEMLCDQSVQKLMFMHDCVHLDYKVVVVVEDDGIPMEFKVFKFATKEEAKNCLDGAFKSIFTINDNYPTSPFVNYTSDQQKQVIIQKDCDDDDMLGFGAEDQNTDISFCAFIVVPKYY